MENSEQIAARSVRRLSASTFSPARFICLAVGGMAVVSAGLINPPMVGLFRDNYLDYRDVSLEYMATGLDWVASLYWLVCLPLGQNAWRADYCFLSVLWR